MIFAFLIFSSILTTIPVNGFVNDSLEPLILENLNDYQQSPKIVTHHEIILHEKLAMTTDDQSKDVVNTQDTKFSSHKKIQFDEKYDGLITQRAKKILESVFI